MEALRYVIVFLVVGWGGALIAAVLSLVGQPILSRWRASVRGQVLGAGINGLAVLLSVYIAYLACQWTGGHLTYAMFLAPLVGIVLNDRWRIRRARHSYSLEGKTWEHDPEFRSGVLRSERMNIVADLCGLAAGILVVPIPELA